MSKHLPVPGAVAVLSLGPAVYHKSLTVDGPPSKSAASMRNVPGSAKVSKVSMYVCTYLHLYYIFSSDVHILKKQGWTAPGVTGG